MPARRRSCTAWSQQLASRAQLPMPRVYIIDTAQPNAFATGRDPQHAAVAVTTGLLRSLSHQELAGVLAHELAHVRNRDTLIMTVTATIAGALGMLANFGLFFGGNRDNQGGHDHQHPGGDPGADGGDDRAVRHLAHPRVCRRPGRRRDLRPSAVARLGAAEAGVGRPAHRQPHGRGQSGDGAPVHRQSAARPLDGQPVLDPPLDREPGAQRCANWRPAPARSAPGAEDLDRSPPRRSRSRHGCSRQGRCRARTGKAAGRRRV